ncbi:3-keto-disaccharide hydrolase [Maribacter polysiphoniae]|uniref:3-keto-disaccharide hydrolase n=1 Tax=Maribacter polysiphoniae TaxID=429344 RepID=UPI002354846F|nr:DUF1080 domain-containing protein [Maribacter polysiphoniae]
MNIKKLRIVAVVMLVTLSFQLSAQEGKSIEGKWNLTISQDGKQLPSWLEISHSGFNTLVGRFVYAFGSARPIAEVKLNKGKFSFAIPPQWEPGKRYMEFEGIMEGDLLKGKMVYTDGKTYEWTGTRAPKLAYNPQPIWGAPKALFNGKNLEGWHAEGENQWKVKNGVLTSEKSGVNLISDEKFDDFKLHIEFRYPEESNSGIYLRGRYEVQIADNKGLEPSSIYFGGIYGFLTPNEMAAKAAGEWQAYDITLIGRRVTIVANGKEIITNQNIPGMTGGALDNNEAEPGSFLIQGDHGPVEFRSIVVTPALD